METMLKIAMKASISEVLGTMFYMPLEFDMEEVLEKSFLWQADALLAASLSFKGPFNGLVIFWVPENILCTMTSDFLGEQCVSKEQMAETLKEIVNMVAGNTFSNFDNTREFRLGIPGIITRALPGSPVLSGRGLFLGIESVEGPLGLWIGFTS
ncbi:chemotaxis protein CheX [Desulfobotulus sp. H1]|uniref:Chemotaxis protein CheX n=1 Tax=Desulfobotulus pelophilus TaxID=2823377 RepID=A0ABT3NEN6_9BACT|nr:chemotaxis protein CheX [Desulfobotulus pelophilus]MCW7755357.1 chemotaxis protein CheX [Desulfobotulus pelophilus]